MPRKVLYIEDNPANKLLVKRILESEGYIVLEAEDGLSGIEAARQGLPDLILMDINIPGMDGYEATTKLKSLEELSQIPIVAVTAKVMRGDRERALTAGCDGYIEKPIDIDRFPQQIEEYFKGKKEAVPAEHETHYLREYSQKLVGRLEDKIKELEIKNQRLERQGREMEETYLNIMTSLMRAMEEKDIYTAGHSERVTKYALAIAESMHLAEKEKRVLARACELHDIGKLVVDLSCINKQGALTREEWMQMAKHPVVGANILAPLRFLSEEVDLIKHHHERWDGRGYPSGLKGFQINTLTSIIIVVDSFDAMTSDRSYRSRRNTDWAVEEMMRCKNTHFNPEVVDIFVKLLQERRVDPEQMVKETAHA